MHKHGVVLEIVRIAQRSAIGAVPGRPILDQRVLEKRKQQQTKNHRKIMEARGMRTSVTAVKISAADRTIAVERNNADAAVALTKVTSSAEM